ncbi:MAG: hemerythrin domain-containing protein [Nakamurella sp.]
MSEREEGARLVAWGREMYRVHAHLRDALENTRDSLADGGPPELARDLLVHCRGFCTALDSHHRGEDAVLFPAIRAAHPHLASTLGS